MSLPAEGSRDGERRDLYAMRSRPPLHERGRPQRGDQRGLTDVTLADHQQLRLVLRLGIVKTAQVRGKLSRPALGKLRQRVSQRIPLKTQLKAASQEIRQPDGQPSQLVTAQVQGGEGGQVPQRLRHRRQLVTAQVQGGEGVRFPSDSGTDASWLPLRSSW